MTEKGHNAYLLKKKLLDIDAGEEKDFMSTAPESLVDGEADNEGVSDYSCESDSDFDVEHEKELKSWSTKRNMAEGI